MEKEQKRKKEGTRAIYASFNNVRLSKGIFCANSFTSLLDILELISLQYENMPPNMMTLNICVLK